DPDDARYGYAMSQGGNVGRYDYETGYTYSIKPTSPDLDTKLRFHWNAGIELDPFDNSTLYFGSQFLHKSTDKGQTWEIISPDLTTNDPEKQTYNKSGGLTLDVTGAENHTTIIAIGVSPVEKGVVWVGTDDGNIQLTRDGGKNWTNFAGKLPGLPAYSWIPQIQPSSYTAGEALVVANNYRMGDFSSYAYRTRDFGSTWERIVDDSDVYGYALSIIQDPAEPNLLFLGTEHGLWVSIDNANSWTQWKNGYPSVSTMDMVIQEREADLVIGTFGRAVYILDDIRPLREIAATNGKVLHQKFKVFDPPDAYMINSFQQPLGNHFPGDATYQGENKPYGGAILSYYLREDKKEDKKEAPVVKPKKSKEDPPESKPEKNKVKYDSLTIHVYDGAELIRTLKYKAKPGLNQVMWRLRKKGVQYPNPRTGRSSRGGGNRQAEPAGFIVMPGDYKVVMSCGDQKDSTTVSVLFDPRIEMDIDKLKANEEMFNEINKKAVALNTATTRLAESKAVLEKISTQVKGNDDLKELADETKSVQDSLNIIWEYIFGKEEKKQGISDFGQPTVLSRLYSAVRYIQSRPAGPTPTEERLMEQANTVIIKALDMTNAFYSDTWPAYRAKVEDTDFKWFKDYEPIEIQ
ncbi:WD40/YVTN/BNR-like repeat-containing protein, partial [Bacteroidota bacterium]